MNIFVLDRDPVRSAQMLCDAHVVKMIVESCQLLSTHDRLTGRWDDDSGLYKATHENHPCRLCLSNEANRSWLILHLKALLSEYTFRYGKVHKCAEIVRRYYNSTVYNLHCYTYETTGRQYTFPKCMPDEFKTGDNSTYSIVQSYRNYYIHKQHTMHRFKYTKREMPDWLGDL